MADGEQTKEWVYKNKKIRIYIVAHEYSVRVHDWLKDKINDVNLKLKQARDKNDGGNESYFNGQLEQLKDIRQYLTDHIDLNTQKYYQ